MLRYLESNSSNSTQKRKPTSSFLNLSLFSGSAPARSPRNFDAGGGVGLGIAVALASGEDVGGGAVVRATKPIATKRARTREEMERSESYTCVISHVGGKKVKKRVYFGDGSDEFDDEFVETLKSAEAQLAAEYPIADFLRNCYLCERNLDGLDVYMYRGERAFCSPECREQHLLSDEFWENCGSEATKSYDYECPESPCSGLCSAAGVAAA